MVSCIDHIAAQCVTATSAGNTPALTALTSAYSSALLQALSMAIALACTLLRDVDNPASHQHIQANLSTLRRLTVASQ